MAGGSVGWQESQEAMTDSHPINRTLAAVRDTLLLKLLSGEFVAPTD